MRRTSAIAWPVAQTWTSVIRPFALDIALIDDEMRRLDRGVGIELEREARMAGAVNPVIDEFASSRRNGS
jgi:hypothetical protein